MDFAEITISSKTDFDHFIKLHQPEISELTFTNLFAWRRFYNFRYRVISGLLCIISVPERGEPFAMMPIGDLNRDNFIEVFHRLKEYFTGQCRKLIFRKVAKKELNYFTSESTVETIIEYDRDNSDYLYKSSDLINLRGKKYDGKRNHINGFKRNYHYEYIPLDASLLGECGRIMDEWCRDKNCSCQKGAYCERYVNQEMLQNFGKLDYKGALIKVDGAYEAFTTGEMLNSDTAVIHIEKANAAINGLYTIINQQFVMNEWGKTLYINREQDLGSEGIRKAKLSYHPFKLIEKYVVICV